MYSISSSRFQKKYSFLESTLTTFLYWREQTDLRVSQSKSQKQKSFVKTSTSTLDQEFILMKKIPYKDLYENRTQKSLEHVQSNLFEFINEACLPKSVFSQKPSFLKYWLIPFISFSVFLPKTTSLNSPLPIGTQVHIKTNREESNKTIPQLAFQDLFADEILKSHYQNVLENEKHELSMLANYYNQSLVQDLGYIHDQNPFDHFSTKILEYQSRKSAIFNWKWFQIQNPTTLVPVDKTLGQTTYMDSITSIPFKIDPKIDTLELKNKNLLKMFPLNYKTPIDSYKNAQYLLDNLTLNFVGSTDILFSNPKNLNKSTNLLNMIDKLDEFIHLSNSYKSGVNFENDSPYQMRELKDINLNVQKSLDDIGKVLKNQFLQTYLLKLLNNEKNRVKSEDLLNKIHDYREFLSFYNKKQFYNKLKQNNFKKLKLNSFKPKRTKDHLPSSLNISKSILNTTYSEFYLKHFLNLFQDFQSNGQKLNNSINPVLYELLLLKNLKNLPSISNLNITEELKPNLISKEFDKFLTILQHNSQDQLLVDKPILKLQRPFQMVTWQNLKGTKLNNQKQLLLKKPVQEQDKFLTFINQNSTSNQYSGWLASSIPNKTKIDNTKSSFFLIHLWERINQGSSISQMYNPIIKWNLLQVLKEIMFRFNTVQNSLTEIQTHLLAKNETEWLLNSEMNPYFSSFAAEKSNVKVKIVKKPNYLLESTTEIIQDRRKMEKVLRAYLSSKMSIPTLNRTENDFQFYRTKEEKLVSLKRLKLKLQKNSTNPISVNLATASPFRVNQKLQPKKLPHQVSLNPHNLLKRIGFVFLNKWERDNKFGDLDSIQVLKIQQKKLRRKKQKLKTRHRKKRKRWYPRPTWLRLQMYQDFLQVHHFPKHRVPSLKFYSTNSFRPTPVALKQYIYRQNQQKWGHISTDQTNLEKRNIHLWNLTNSLPISSTQDFYKISNETMNEVQRLCWKSSWLRSNLNVYINRIQNNLKKMKESQKMLSSNLIFQKFGASFFGLNPSDFNTLISITKQPKTQLPSLDWYLNYRTSFDFPEMNPSFSLFQNQIHSKNYDEVLTKRISNIIKNVKINLTKSGEVQAYSFIQGRRKLEKSQKPNRIEKFFYNLTSSGIPLSPLNYWIDNLLIPSNQISRLRTGWALNRTHGFTFKKNNDIQKVWQYVKSRDQSKHNKTKKFIRKSISRFFPKNKGNLSFEKTRNIQTKLSWHRTNHYFSKRLFEQEILTPMNSNVGKRFFSNSRDLKFYLKTQVHNNFKLPNSLKGQTQDWSTLPLFQIQKPQKNELHFWWSVQNSFQSFSPMSLISFDTIERSTTLSSPAQSWIFVNTIWICAFLFHLSILFSLFQISEVRSLFKFYFLIITKFSQGYFIVLKMTWQFLENYSQSIKKIGLSLKKETLKLNELELTSNLQSSSKIVWINNSQRSIPRSKDSFIVQLWVRFPITAFTSLKTGFDPWAKLTPNENSIFENFSNNPIYQTNVSKQIESNSLIFNEVMSLIRLPLFFVAKSGLVVLDSSFRILYIGVYKIIDLLETCIMLIYHFFEKPAEVMMEWIGNVFLIEWSSDFVTFVPDLFDTQLWNSFSKLSRGSRVSPIVGNLIQRQFQSMTEALFASVMKPDTDLLERQKKGILFWDIWGEILIQAAENYQMNLISLLTLKEEQDLFMEKLLEDSNWEWASPSLMKMRPLLQFLNKDGQLNQLSSTLFSPYSQLYFSLNPSNPACINVNSNSKSLSMTSQDLTDGRTDSYMNQWKRWSVNQAYTYQTKDSDLFVDFHPPNSFQHLSFLKSTPIAQQTLGPLVCQIYSGRFVNEIAKNILLVGSSGMAKTLLIQALAGETELKFMRDHSQRYAVVQQGVAVGMKALKDVFDAIALYSPCIFLLEDIHLIGSKRSMLISEHETHLNNEEIFGVEEDEVHEKNQVFYHWTRYQLVHYQRPYKSDFSVNIPTNQFCFDLFFGIQPPKARFITPKTPLPISNIETQLMHQNLNPFEQSIESIDKAFQTFTKTNRISSLQLPKEQTVSPPATSPFLIFALKEKQTLKPRKRVKQIPWGGFSSDQMNLLPKTAYSVRIKVALLADLAMRNLSVKLDMITDLLVIVDNVRSNRGFVVFATTHMPSLLDPALRRPGRFDETISLPIFPNFLTRWEIFKTHLGDFSSTCDFFDYALITPRFTETNLLQLISETKLALFNLNDPLQPYSQNYPIRSINQSFKAITEQPILLPIRNSMNQVKLSQNPALLTSLTYFQLGMTVVRQNLLQNQNAYHTLSYVKLQQLEKPEEFLFKQLYSPTYELKNQVTQFFAGKIAQFLITNPSTSSQNFYASKFYNDKNRCMISNFGVSKQHEAVGGFELFWNSATSFVSGLIHKRFLYQTNSVTSSLLNFDNLSLLLKPLSPPASTISMPAKKYENFQRIHKDFQQKMNLSIQDKLEIHQKQRLIYNLYQKPIQQRFRSENFSDRLTSFTNAFPELGYFDSIMLKPTSVNAYYQNRFVTRHKFSFVYQWWNGQLAEHNIESTFLSDVDWRSMFVRSIGDLVIDFPDAEQYYNPRNRRWFLNSSSWGYWLNFEKTFSEEIAYHFMVECFHKSFNYLQNQREILDYAAHLYLQEGVLKEIDFVMLKSRFYLK